MLSFINYPDFEGIPIAVVNNLDKKTKKQKTLYMYTTQVPDGQMEVSLEGDEEFEKTIDDSQEREVIYVSGMSGAGKCDAPAAEGSACPHATPPPALARRRTECWLGGRLRGGAGRTPESQGREG